MHPARIAELLRPFLQDANDQRPTANNALIQHISTYIDVLLHWNSRMNLTAIRNPEEIVTRHFGESLFTASQLFPSVNPRPEARLADLGSGAGFPGLPIKLWAPNIALTLIESNHKKATFLREVTRALTLTEVDIQNVRAETLPPRTFDVVTLRAVEHLADALPIAATLVRPAGRIALLTSSARLMTALSTLPSFIWHPPTPIPQSNSRVLVVAQNMSPKTPARNSQTSSICP